MTNTIEFEVYFDFLCPYVNAAALWLRDVQRQSGEKIRPRWRFFPLEQVNATEGPDWKLWDQADTYDSRGLPAFRAAVAARQQGEDAFTRMQYAILAARHEEKRDTTQRDVLVDLARASDLNVDQFEHDLSDRSLLDQIGADYEAGRQQHGVFGTPTFVFPEGTAAYLKVLPPPPEAEALTFFEEFLAVVRNQTFVHEIKRPTKP